ncbi:interferon gamma receptor 1 isoform 2-T2 [Synchiropus picturatus]
MRNGSLLSVAFTALATLLLVVGGVTVSSPENLTVTCHDLRVSASWTHSDHQAGTSFLVTVSAQEGVATQMQLETLDQKLDLSSEVSGSLDRLLATYVVTVAARRGGLRSTAASRTFSFNQVKGLEGCQLDFPPVDVTRKGHKLLVAFKNPLYHHKELRDASDTEFAMMEFHVESDGGHHSWTCMKEKLCNISIVANGSCVRLKDGFLFKDHRLPSASFRFKDSQRACADGSAEPLILTLGISLAVLVAIVTMLTLVICKVKALMLKPSPLPKTLTRKVEVYPGWVCPDPVYDLVHTVPPSPEPLHEACSSDALCDAVCQEEEEEEEEEDAPDRARRVDLGDGETVMAYSELRNGPADDSGESLQTESEYMEKVGLESSPYDRPHCPVVDLASGTSEPPQVRETSGVAFSAGRSDPLLSGPPDLPTPSEDRLPDDTLKPACDITEWEESQEEEGASSPYDRPHCPLVDLASGTSEPAQVRETTGDTFSAGQSDPVHSGPHNLTTRSEGHPPDPLENHLPEKRLKPVCDITEWEESQGEEGASSPYDRPH